MQNYPGPYIESDPYPQIKNDPYPQFSRIAYERNSRVNPNYFFSILFFGFMGSSPTLPRDFTVQYTQ